MTRRPFQIAFKIDRVFPSRIFFYRDSCRIFPRNRIGCFSSVNFDRLHLLYDCKIALSAWNDLTLIRRLSQKRVQLLSIWLDYGHLMGMTPKSRVLSITSNAFYLSNSRIDNVKISIRSILISLLPLLRNKVNCYLLFLVMEIYRYYWYIELHMIHHIEISTFPFPLSVIMQCDTQVNMFVR